MSDSITIEPAFATACGTFHVEANVAITGRETTTLSVGPGTLRTIER